MRDYRVKKYTDIGYVIYSTSVHNPTDCISEIERELIRTTYKGNVVFDLLLANGNNFNRYLTAYFNGISFNSESYQLISHPKDDLKQKSIDFYQKNIELLENSILSKPVKFMIKKGYSI